MHKYGIVSQPGSILWFFSNVQLKVFVLKVKYTMNQQDFAIKSQDTFASGNKISANILAKQDATDKRTVVSADYTVDRQHNETYKNIIQQVHTGIMEQNYQAAGAGSFESLYPKIFTRFDRFHKRYYTPNTVYSGYTFITRPRLCLTSTNLQADRYLQLFNTTNPNTIQFAIKCLFRQARALILYRFRLSFFLILPVSYARLLKNFLNCTNKSFHLPHCAYCYSVIFLYSFL